MLRLIQRSKNMRGVFLNELMRRRVVVEAAGLVIYKRRRPVNILKPSLEITHLPADQSFQADIGIVVACVESLQIKFPVCLDVPFLVTRLVSVFRMPDSFL